MLINDFRIQYATAFPNPEPVSSGKGNTLHGQIYTDIGMVNAYIKVIPLAGVIKEALCAVLARKLHLPVPAPYYVCADPVITKMPAANTLNIAFGLEAGDIRFPRVLDRESLNNELLKWPELERCACFDSWIANRDRIPNNLLYAGFSDFWMIDHDDALPNYQSETSSVSPQLFQLIKENKSEIELYQTRDRMMRFVDQILQINWSEIKDLLKVSEIEGAEPFYETYSTFLINRSKAMRKILTVDLNIKQASLELNNPSKREIKEDQI